MHEIEIPFDQYFDKVYGCWLGKNAGGTLGAPLEKLFSSTEKFNVDWYPELKEGGIPNDDLEVQLVLLQALREKGPGVTSADLAKSWVKHIRYNYDEYGLHKTNVRLGLLPPLSGNFNNWFKDCMGCPIRSEIWACVAPGHPEIAAHYAYQDAICDHAGGESVYGEIFNAVMESMAFFLSDTEILVELALKSIPVTSKTYGAVLTALSEYKSGKTWEETRETLVSEFFSPIAQYSPINLGFQTIGLLYGTTFGEAICIAVNCGWDTDCTGATVGAIWGIIHGKKNLPENWLEPLGDNVVVSKGIQNLDFPKNLKQLTYETCALGKQVIDYWNPHGLVDSQDELDYVKLFEEEIEKIQTLWDLPVDFTPILIKGWELEVKIYFPNGPGIYPDVALPIKLWIQNTSEQQFSGELIVLVRDQWEISNPSRIPIILAPHEIWKMPLTLKVPIKAFGNFSGPLLRISNKSKEKSWEGQVPVIPAHRWQISEVFPSEKFKKRLPPEKGKNKLQKGSGWKSLFWVGNNLSIETYFNSSPGVVYLRHFIFSQVKNKDVRLGVPNNSRMKLWLNGRKIKSTKKVVPLRPNYSGDGANYARVSLKKGWNIVLIKFMRENYALSAHFTIANTKWADGLVDVIRYRLPWEKE